MLNQATRLLAASPEYTKRNIRISAVSPGHVKTDMGGADAPRSLEQGGGRRAVAACTPSALTLRARSILSLVNHPEPRPTGQFFEDGKQIEW